MDSTLIETKSGATFAKNKDDWKLWNECVPDKLKEYIKKGYRVVIFTNQGGIGIGKTKAGDFQQKAEAIQAALNVPLTVVISTHKDEYHKPSKGMWTYFQDNLNGGIKVDLAESYYVGDAAGRPASKGKKKDFSDSDLKFALNVGLNFQTPEQFFLGEKASETAKAPAPAFDPKNMAADGLVFVGEKDNKAVTSDKLEAVIFVGSPASGKSTFWQNYMPNYVRVNRDTLKTKEKCVKVMRETLKGGKSCVIDNTNPENVDRKLFLDVAAEFSSQI
jgi:bifunctional polynucleotide phosphatase/kinase